MRVEPHELAGVALLAPGLEGLLTSDLDVLLALRDRADGDLEEDARLEEGRGRVDQDDVDGLPASGQVVGHEAVQQWLRHEPNGLLGLLPVQEMGHRFLPVPFCLVIVRCEKQATIIPQKFKEINIIGRV